MHAHLQLYIVSDVRHPIFPWSIFFFLSKQDGYGVKVALISCRFETPLTRTLYFSMVFNSKHKISCLDLS